MNTLTRTNEHRAPAVPLPVARRRDWTRPALIALLGATALLYLWGLGASGWANSYYSAAVQAATKSWKALVFGSFDSSNFITVDKSPGALWVMDLFARVFGLNAWSILVPQAIEGVAAVALLYATVKRVFSPAAGLIAGAVLALTPVATLMFRYNNPDALLTLLLIGAAYALVRALEDTRTRWLVAMGALLGFAFLAKMLQAFIVVPVFGLVYLFAADTPLRRRIVQLLAAGASMLVAGGWWVAVVALTPASARPFVGGSQNNSIFNLIFGYNGFGRITGNERGSVGGFGGGTGAGRWGATGLTRLFNAEIGGQISWLLPAALVLGSAMVLLTVRLHRTDRRRASVLMWGGWLVLTGLVFSLAKGIFHPYYTVALAPAVGAMVGIGAVTFWKHRARYSYLLSGTVLVSTWWSFVLLGRSPAWMPWLRGLVLVGGLFAAAALAVSRGRLLSFAAFAAVAVALAGPAAYSIETAANAPGGAIPSAGPAIAGARFGPGGPGGPGAFGPPSGAAQGTAAPRLRGGPGGLGGLLDARTPDASLAKLLGANAHSYEWVAATTGANSGAGVQLATGEPVLAIGGFNGTDPTPTLAEFQSLVQQEKIHYFLSGGDRGPVGGGPGGFFGGPGGGGPGSSGTGSTISTWVQANYTAQTVGGVTVYDLTKPKGV